jgi:predicted dehydrogenase
MVTCSEDADHIIEAMNQAHRKVGVNHNRLFLSTVKKAKTLVDRGSIGKLTGVDVRFFFHVPHMTENPKHWCHSLPGGIFGEMLPHALYLVRFFLGDTKFISSRNMNIKHGEFLKGDESRVILEGKSGLGTISCSFNAPRTIEIVEILGSKGNVHIVLDEMLMKWGYGRTSKASYFFNEYIYSPFENFKGILSRGIADSRYLLGINDSFGTLGSIKSFVAAVERDDVLLVTAEDGKAISILLEQVLHQSNNG